MQDVTVRDGEGYYPLSRFGTQEVMLRLIRSGEMIIDLAVFHPFCQGSILRASRRKLLE